MDIAILLVFVFKITVWNTLNNLSKKYTYRRMQYFSTSPDEDTAELTEEQLLRYLDGDDNFEKEIDKKCMDGTHPNFVRNLNDKLKPLAEGWGDPTPSVLLGDLNISDSGTTDNSSNDNENSSITMAKSCKTTGSSLKAKQVYQLGKKSATKPALTDTTIKSVAEISITSSKARTRVPAWMQAIEIENLQEKIDKLEDDKIQQECDRFEAEIAREKSYNENRKLAREKRELENQLAEFKKQLNEEREKMLESVKIEKMKRLKMESQVSEMKKELMDIVMKNDRYCFQNFNTPNIHRMLFEMSNL